MEEVKREYRMSDAELMMFVSNLVHSVLRDAASFTEYGVDAADISAFSALGDSFEVFPPDTYYQAEVGIATDTKDAAREQLILDTRKITNRALAKWDDNYPQYKKFGIKGLTENSDKSLLATARLVAITAADYLAELAEEGLTQQIIDDYSLLAQQFENDLNAVYNAVEARDSKTQERIILGNNLYSFVIKYCRFGKTIWDKVDEAKYNDYVIYPTGSGGGTPDEPPAAPVLSYSPDGFHWDEVATATSYQLVYRASDATEWIELYAGPFPETSVTFEPGNGEWIARLRARNAAGYGDWSEERTVIIGLQPPVIWELIYNPSTNKVTLQWHASIGAEFHDVYQSVVPLGNPAGAFTMIQSVSGQVYQHSVSTYDVTEYYYIIARNTEESSEPTPTVSVDVPAGT